MTRPGKRIRSEKRESNLWLGKMESLICTFYLSVAARKIVRADPSPRYTSMLRLVIEPRSVALEADALPLGQRGGLTTDVCIPTQGDAHSAIIHSPRVSTRLLTKGVDLVLNYTGTAVVAAVFHAAIELHTEVAFCFMEYGERGLDDPGLASHKKVGAYCSRWELWDGSCKTLGLSSVCLRVLAVVCALCTDSSCLLGALVSLLSMCTGSIRICSVYLWCGCQ